MKKKYKKKLTVGKEDLGWWSELSKSHKKLYEKYKIKNSKFRNDIALKYMTSTRKGWLKYSNPNTIGSIDAYYKDVVEKLKVDVHHTDFLLGKPVYIKKDNKIITQDLITTAEEFDIFSKNINIENIKSIVEIGVGYGRTACYLLRSMPNIEHYYIVDISPAIDLTYDYSHEVLEKVNADKIVKINPEELRLYLEKNKINIDCFIAMSSINEMKGNYVNYYLDIIDEFGKYFYYKNTNSHEDCAPNPEDYNQNRSWEEIYNKPSRTFNRMFDRIYKIKNDVVSKDRTFKIIKLKNFSDKRGILSVMTEKNIGFKFSRIYFVRDVPENTVRGDHAHVYTEQFLVCLAGECEVKIDNGKVVEYIKLNNSDMSGLLVPPMNWCEITYKDENTILLVLASHDYDPDDYIHDYNEFKDRIRK